MGSGEYLEPSNTQIVHDYRVLGGCCLEQPKHYQFMAVRRSKNRRGGGNVVGIICPLVEIRLTDLLKSGGSGTPDSYRPEY